MTKPLSLRIQVPDVVPPIDADGVLWRPATPDDVDAILDLESAVASVDHPRYTSSRDEIADDLRAPHIEPARDTLVAASDGRLLAWGVVALAPAHETAVRVSLGGGVRPSARGRGHGRRLLAWQRARALQRLAAVDSSLPASVQVWVDAGAADTRRLLTRAGFEPHRYFLDLRRELADPIPDRAEPEGLRIVRVGGEHWTDGHWDAVRDARNATFRDHWGSQPMTQERWRAFVSRETLHPEWSFVALAPDGEVAAFVLVDRDEHNWALQGHSSGYVDLVGTRRQWRGRGAASALLTRAMQAAAADGVQRMVLDVDSDSPTGAVGLYSALGFVEAARSVVYVQDL